MDLSNIIHNQEQNTVNPMPMKENGRRCLKRKLIDCRADDRYKEPWPVNKFLSPDVFKDDTLTIGGQLKAKGEVLLRRDHVRCRPPNTTCRIETFARICQTFDDRRVKWVLEMGFGGLLHFVGDMHLPRQLSYWLMTRIDPFNCTLTTTDGRVFALSKNQVHWVLGIPNSGMKVPTYKTMTKESLEKIHQIMGRYGKSWNSKSNKTGRHYKSEGIPVNKKLMDRVEGHWEENEGDEFKMLFLLLSLDMLLCPTQSSRLASDLLPSLVCAPVAYEYDWCSLVLKKLMDSVATFARRFYFHGYASGCGGCLLFAVVLYLDRLNRQPVEWGVFPRIEVWTMNRIRDAIKDDRLPNGGDFGLLSSLDVAYGERHPLLARDTDGPTTDEERVVLSRPRKWFKPTPRRVSLTNNLRQKCSGDEVPTVCVICHCISTGHRLKLCPLNGSSIVGELQLLVMNGDEMNRLLYSNPLKSNEMVKLCEYIAGKQYCSTRPITQYAFSLVVILKFCGAVRNQSWCLNAVANFISNRCFGFMVLVSHDYETQRPLSRMLVALKWASDCYLYVLNSCTGKRIRSYDQLLRDLDNNSLSNKSGNTLMVSSVTSSR